MCKPGRAWNAAAPAGCCRPWCYGSSWRRSGCDRQRHAWWHGHSVRSRVQVSCVVFGAQDQLLCFGSHPGGVPLRCWRPKRHAWALHRLLPAGTRSKVQPCPPASPQRLHDVAVNCRGVHSPQDGRPGTNHQAGSVHALGAVRSVRRSWLNQHTRKEVVAAACLCGAGMWCRASYGPSVADARWGLPVHRQKGAGAWDLGAAPGTAPHLPCPLIAPAGFLPATSRR